MLRNKGKRNAIFTGSLALFLGTFLYDYYNHIKRRKKFLKKKIRLNFKNFNFLLNIKTFIILYLFILNFKLYYK